MGMSKAIGLDREAAAKAAAAAEMEMEMAAAKMHDKNAMQGELNSHSYANPN